MKVISLVGAKKIKSPVKTVLKGFTEQNILLAHSMLEQGHTIGKIVIDTSTHAEPAIRKQELELWKQ